MTADVLGVANTVAEIVGTRKDHGPWRLIFATRDRPVAVPAFHRAARRQSIAFFLPRLAHRGYAHAVTAMAGRFAIAPTLEFAPGARPRPLAPAARPATGDVAEVSFRVGTPGPHQKVSLLMMRDDGVPLCVAKVASSPSANDTIEAESRWLAILDRHAVLRGCVPRLLDQGMLEHGKRFLVSSALVGAPGRGRLSAGHESFLRALSRVRVGQCDFEDSAACRHLHRLVDESRSYLAPAEYEFFAHALHDCVMRLRGWSGPFHVAHCDFVPWNTRRVNGAIVAFDWEYARDGAGPLTDLLHFLLLPQAVHRRPMSAHTLLGVQRRAGAYATRTHRDVDWNERVLGAHLLAYLMETVLFFAASRQALMPGHPVIGAYNALIAARGSWLQ